MISDNISRFYLDGAWVDPLSDAVMPVEDPATGARLCDVPLGGAADVDRAVGAARRAFGAWSNVSLSERIGVLRRMLAAYHARAEDMAEAMRAEMGAPITWARDAQVWAGAVHLEAAITSAETMIWEETRGTTRIVHEGIGVCGLITPWNWPMNQIVCKVAPALVAGCTVVLKPSEIAPLSAVVWAEICNAAGVPAGVFNLVQGMGPDAGAALAAHPDVDMISFTGSTRAGTAVAALAAPTVKRVAQELGGKSANIILPSADIAAAVKAGVEGCFANTGQSCDAPTRMFVPRASLAEVEAIARSVASQVVIGPTTDPATTMGPLISQAQFIKVQALIDEGLREGARLVCGGPGRPNGAGAGYYTRPTVFSDVRNDMIIAREEIFGPVLCLLPYDSLEDAVAAANDTPYGLAAYVSGALPEARAVARRLRAGQVNINAPEWDVFAPFGGYKQSGNGREYADWGIRDFCEVKAMVGYDA